MEGFESLISGATFRQLLGQMAHIYNVAQTVALKHHRLYIPAADIQMALEFDIFLVPLISLIFQQKV